MTSLNEFAAAGPWPQRAVLGALVSLARRRRGRALLRYLPQVDQLMQALLATEHFDDPAVSRRLGWDPAAVIARGRDLRRLEGRL